MNAREILRLHPSDDLVALVMLVAPDAIPRVVEQNIRRLKRETPRPSSPRHYLRRDEIAQL